jgi:hypothetical protein
MKSLIVYRGSSKTEVPIRLSTYLAMYCVALTKFIVPTMGVGSLGEFMDIKTMSDLDLVQSLQDRPQVPFNPIHKWWELEGYYPGTTRVEAHKLYAAFQEWLTAYAQQHPGITVKPPGLKTWGWAMSGRFKKGRAKTGAHYYISRQDNSEVLGSVGVIDGIKG